MFSAARTYYKATTLTLPATAAGGAGISLELVNKTFNPAFVCGIELTAVNPDGVAAPTADVELSLDGGATWSTIGAGVAADALGRGAFTFTPESASDNALVRVTSRDESRPADTSDAPFQVAPAGRDFYVNDASTFADVFTTAPGANANHGKSPAKPMATIAAVFTTYDLGPGDVIHVDSGSSDLVHDYVLTARESGLRVEGPGAAPGAAAGAAPGLTATLNRRNPNALLFDLRNVDDVTLDRLVLRDAATGVHASSASDSDGVTVSNSENLAMQDYSVYAHSDNDNWTVAGNRVHDNVGGFGRTSTGIYSGRSRTMPAPQLRPRCCRKPEPARADRSRLRGPPPPQARLPGPLSPAAPAAAERSPRRQARVRVPAAGQPR